MSYMPEYVDNLDMDERIANGWKRSRKEVRVFDMKMLLGGKETRTPPWCRCGRLTLTGYKKVELARCNFMSANKIRLG